MIKLNNWIGEGHSRHKNGDESGTERKRESN